MRAEEAKMLHVVQFSASADADTVLGEVRGLLGAPGIRSMTLFEATTAAHGQPRFMVQIEAEDTQDDTVRQRIESGIREYEPELWAVSHRTYRQVR
jgi:hypothetical protein